MISDLRKSISAREGVNSWLTLEQARTFLRTGAGAGIKIAILDSGVETRHPRLKGLKLTGDFRITEEALQLRVEPGDGTDLYGHGTAIASILHELAPEAQIGSFRIFGSQLRSRTAVICEAARVALDRGYHILNCSFGCGREDQVLRYKDWIDEAYIRGRHIVAACNNLDFSKREWPGHFPTAITVNFLKAERADQLFFQRGTLVEFSASGQDLAVPWKDGGEKKVTGSSFAAPHAAGLLARLLSGCPDLPPLEAKALLQRLAKPWAGT